MFNSYLIFQVGSAILELRQHNTFQGKLTSPWFRSTENSVLAGPCSNSESYVLEVVETSRQKAKTLVDQSVQVSMKRLCFLVFFFCVDEFPCLIKTRPDPLCSPDHGIFSPVYMVTFSTWINM